MQYLKCPNCDEAMSNYPSPPQEEDKISLEGEIITCEECGAEYEVVEEDADGSITKLIFIGNVDEVEDEDEEEDEEDSEES